MSSGAVVTRIERNHLMIKASDMKPEIASGRATERANENRVAMYFKSTMTRRALNEQRPDELAALLAC